MTAFVQKWVRLKRVIAILGERNIPAARAQDEIASAIQSGFKQVKFPEMPPILALDRSWRATPNLDFEKSTVVALCKSWDPREQPQPRAVILELPIEEIDRLWPAVELPTKAVKPKRGNPGIHDWIEGEAFAHGVMDGPRGDPTNPDDQVKGWKTISDLARLILTHLSKGDPDQEPDFSLTCKKAKLFIQSWRAKQDGN